MKRYERHGLLAIDPRALMTPVGETPPDRSNLRLGKTCIVRVCGPLDHHSQQDSSLDSYDDIRARFAEACASDASVVLLKLDSPGGMVAGCFELARDLRVKATAAGKRLVAYVDGHACSAAYALASAAPEIVIPESGVAGSIGVIDARVDATAMDAAMGLRFAVITSGERKADGNPHVALTEAELDDRQSLVNALAGVFFALVADHRKRPAATFAALQARQLNGSAAVKAGLADRVQTFDELLASFEGAGAIAMASRYDEAKAALAEAAKGDDDEAARARKALAAMDDEPAEDAEGDDPPADDEEKRKKAAAAAAAASASVSAGAAAQLAARVTVLERENSRLKATKDADERKALLASRADLGADLVKTLAALPLADVRAIVANIPMPPAKPKAPKPAAAAAAAAPPVTRGAGQSGQEGASALTYLSPQAKTMDAAMGLAAIEGGVTRSATKATFSVAGNKKVGAK